MATAPIEKWSTLKEVQEYLGVGRESILQWIATVSYTHLDVYKRQVDLSIVAGLLLLVFSRNTGIGRNTLFDYRSQRSLHEARIDRRLDDLHLSLSYLSLHSASSFVQQLFPAFQPSSFLNGKEKSISLHGLYHPLDGKPEGCLAWHQSVRYVYLRLPHHIQRDPALGSMCFSICLLYTSRCV